MKTLLEKQWNGKELREIVEFNGKKFKIVTGLRNGLNPSKVYLFTDNGLEVILFPADLPVSNWLKSLSYVSPESQRKTYAESLNVMFKQAIKKIYHK